MRDLFATGAARVVPTENHELRPARWALKPARLARMDRLCALALLAADGALSDAGLDAAAISSWSGARVAVVFGTAFGCHATNEEYYRGLLADGVRGASPRLFAYTLPSSPVGEITIHYGASGPAEAVASGRHAGIEALERAARLCAGGSADLAIAVAAETAGTTALALGLDLCDRAAAVVVERGEQARARGARLRARIAGAGSSFRAASAAAAGEEAVKRALDEAGLSRSAIDRPPFPGGDGAVAPLESLARWLEHPGSRPLGLWVATDPGGGAAALLATTPGD